MKNFFIVLIVLVIAFAGWVFYKTWMAQQPLSQTQQATLAASPSQPMASQSALASATPMQVTVTYTENGFSPKTITVKKGTTVVFVNRSSQDMWPASNPHPIHNDYPTTGGCVASTFDACARIVPGQSWSFTFTIPGSWGYHNHLNPGAGGTINVQK